MENSVQATTSKAPHSLFNQLEHALERVILPTDLSALPTPKESIEQLIAPLAEVLKQADTRLALLASEGPQVSLEACLSQIEQELGVAFGRINEWSRKLPLHPMTLLARDSLLETAVNISNLSERIQRGGAVEGQLLAQGGDSDFQLADQLGSLGVETLVQLQQQVAQLAAPLGVIPKEALKEPAAREILYPEKLPPLRHYVAEALRNFVFGKDKVSLSEGALGALGVFCEGKVAELQVFRGPKRIVSYQLPVAGAKKQMQLMDDDSRWAAVAGELGERGLMSIEGNTVRLHEDLVCSLRTVFVLGKGTLQFSDAAHAALAAFSENIRDRLSVVDGPLRIRSYELPVAEARQKMQLMKDDKGWAAVAGELQAQGLLSIRGQAVQFSEDFIGTLRAAFVLGKGKLELSAGAHAALTEFCDVLKNELKVVKGPKRIEAFELSVEEAKRTMLLRDDDSPWAAVAGELAGLGLISRPRSIVIINEELVKVLRTALHDAKRVLGELVQKQYSTEGVSPEVLVQQAERYVDEMLTQRTAVKKRERFLTRCILDCGLADARLVTGFFGADVAHYINISGQLNEGDRLAKILKVEPDAVADMAEELCKAGILVKAHVPGADKPKYFVTTFAAEQLIPRLIEKTS